MKLAKWNQKRSYEISSGLRKSVDKYFEWINELIMTNFVNIKKRRISRAKNLARLNDRKCKTG